MKRFLTLSALSVALASPLAAQYRTESFQVTNGWNSFFLNVDPEGQTFEEILADSPDVLQVWQWTPSEVDPSLIRPDRDALSEWRVWRRGDAGGSTITGPIPNTAYLVELGENASQQVFSIKGKAVEPQVQFRTDGLNFVGFPMKTGSTLQLNRYLAGAGLFDNNTTVLRYIGGPLADGVNPVERPANLVLAQRNEAFWVRSDQFTNFYGPLEVDVALDDGLNFGDSGALRRLVITNRTDVELSVVLTPVDSEPGIDGGPAPTAPTLTVQGRDEETGRLIYTPFGSSQRLTIPARRKGGITVAVDRASLGGAAGTTFAGLLKIEDQQANGDATTEIYLPITAEQGGLAGLWLGEAHISQVQSRLQKFRRDEDGALVLGEDGQAIPLSEQEAGLANTAQTFKLRLLVHRDAAGQATLLSQAFVGVDGGGDPVIGTTESVLDSTKLAEARRLTTSHFPLDMVEDLSGALAPGGSLATTVVLGENHKSNPFLHTYHPDHDNKDARFNSTPLPAGIESHRIERAITINFDATDLTGVGPAWGGSVLTGEFAETITGLHKQTLQTSGPVAFSKITDIETLNR